MSFGAEMKDFIAAFQVGSQIQDKRRQQALDVEQEKNRSAEASNKAAAVESRYQRTMDYNEAGRADTNKRNAAIDLRAQEQLDLNRTAQERLAGKEADDAWYKQLEANPQLGYDAAGNQIPPPSQRGQPTEAIPTTSAPAAGGGTDDVVINHAIVSDAVDGGMKQLSAQLKSERGVEDVMGGAGAPSVQTIQQVSEIVDPDKVMAEGKRITAMLEATHDFYMTTYKGADKVERANEAAAAIIQYSRSQAAVLATAAQAKMEQGDMAGATAELIKAHDIIPDGRSTTYDEASNTFTVTDDETGEVVQEGEVTPEMLDQIAAGFTKGPLVFEMLLQSAMKSKNFNPGAGDKAAAAPKPVTSVDLVADDEADGMREEFATNLFDLVSTEMVDIDGAPIFASPEEFIAQVGEDSTEALADLSVMITKFNPDINPKDAAKLALVISDADVNVGEIKDQNFGFKVLPVSAENKKAGKDIMVIQTPDGRELELPGNAATTAIRIANRGLFIAGKKIIEKNVGMTNERVINDNNQYNLQRQEDLRLQGKGNRSGARGAGVPLPTPTRRTGRGG